MASENDAPCSEAGRLEAWLGRHARGVLLAVVTAAVVLRLVYFFQLDSGPCLELHRLEQTDMHYYEDWGRRVAAGDWVSASVGVPMHPWHRELGDETQWARWLRPRQFYQDPLYPYLIGLTYRLGHGIGADPNVRFVLAWQMTLGVLSIVLVWVLARRFFGEAVGVTAALLALLSGPLLYYELVLLKESTMACAGLALAWGIERAFTRGGAGRFAALGAGLGLALLLKSTFAVMLAGVVLASVSRAVVRWRRTGEPLGRAWRPVAAVAAGLAVPMGLLAVRNVSVGVPPLALASAGALTFVLSNAPQFPPHLGFAVDTPFVSRVMTETDGRALPAVARTLRAHTVGSYTRLLWRKWFHTWHRFEIPNNESFDYMRLRAPVLRGLPFTFALVSPLALVGLVLAARRLASVWPLYLLVAASLVPLILFYVLGRFRTGLLAAALPFAALTLVQVGRWLARRRMVPAAFALAAVLVLGLWAGQPPLPGQVAIRPGDWMIPLFLRHQEQIQQAMAAGDPARAAAAYADFFRYAPDETQLRATGSADLATGLAQMHEHCAALLRESGRTEEAARQEEQARHLHLLSALLAG
jgi:hypothetical protein